MSQHTQREWVVEPVTVGTPLTPIFVDVNNPTLEERVRAVVREELQAFRAQLLAELANVLRASMGERDPRHIRLNGEREL